MFKNPDIQTASGYVRFTSSKEEMSRYLVWLFEDQDKEVHAKFEPGFIEGFNETRYEGFHIYFYDKAGELVDGDFYSTIFL